MAIGAVLSALLASAGLALVSRRATQLALLVQAVAGAVLAIEGLSLAGGREAELHVGSLLGVLSVDLRYDALSGLFLIALGLVAVSSSLFALGHHGAIRSRGDGFAYAAFLVSMAALFGSDTAFTFLLAWEAMALSSAALVFGPNPGPSTVRAGYIYLALTHLASAAIVVAFAMLAGSDGRLDFASMRAAAQTLEPAARDAAFLLLLLGFATKAGLVPVHVWLPRAHPQAPSHVSALMSGVMVTAGVFGVLRVIIGVLGPGPIWWALLLLALGGLSAILGALYALVERDLKRLLAFSTIENVGIIFLGLGVALIGGSAGLPVLAALGTGAALVHTLNHAAFKGLLFLVAGSIDGATGTRDLDRLGGLVRTMPWTSVLFGVGAVSLAGVPPFSGFAGEWLTFQGLLSAGAASALDPAARLAAMLAVGAIGLSAGLALAAVVKAVGSSLLALPRSTGAGAALEVGRLERGAAAFLAVATIAMGLFAVPVRDLAAAAATATATAATASVRPTDAAIVERLPAGLGGYEPLSLGVVLFLVIVATWAIARRRALPARRVPTWACGIAPTAAHEYTATSFDKPARLFFEPILRPIRSRNLEFEPGAPFPHRLTYRSHVDHLVESRIYVPVHRATIAFAQIARRLQQGTLQLYLAYTVVALVIILIVAR
ncbi:MAG: proton-conducting transporter membrane subunit [Chloroflexota bacterium]